MRLVRYSYPTQRALSNYGYQSPWTGLEGEIDRLFESVLGDYRSPQTNRFPVDVFEDKENVYVRAELPGVDRADINVEMVEDYLTITAARKNSDNGNESSFSFSRSVTVPESVQAEKVAAEYKDGVLTVTLPKKEEAKPRKIAVSVN